jgi:predicted dehydrogenase
LNSADDIRAVVMGCGSIGRRHARLLVERLDPGRVQVMDADPGRSSDLGRTLGVSPVVELPPLGPGETGLALVCTPHQTHVPLALAAARAGYNLFIEKPLCLEPSEADELIAEVDSRRLVAMVGANMRWHPAIRWLGELVAAGTLGDIYCARLHFGQYLPDWRPGTDYRRIYSARADQGGGILMDAIHELDYITALMGPVAELTAHAAKVSDLEIDVEDLAEVTLVFDRGRSAQIHLDSLDRFKRRSCQLIGSRATALWEGWDRFPETAHFGLWRPETGRWEHWTEDVDGDDMFRAQRDHLLDCLAGRAEPRLSLRGAVGDVDLVRAARRAAAERIWVRIEAPREEVNR